MEQFPQSIRDETESTSISTILARSDPAALPAMRTSLSFLTYAGAEIAGALQKRNQEYDELKAVMSAFPPEWIAAARGGGDLPDLGELRRELEAARDQRVDLQAQLAERETILNDLQIQLDEQKALLETQIVREDEADAAVALEARVETLEADIEAAQLARAASEDALREQAAELDDLEVQLSALNDELMAALSAQPAGENELSGGEDELSGGEDIPPAVQAVAENVEEAEVSAPASEAVVADAVEASAPVVQVVAADAPDSAPAAQADSSAAEAGVVVEQEVVVEAEPEIDGRERRAAKLGMLFASVAAITQQQQQIGQALQDATDEVDVLKGELFAVQSDRMALDADLQEKNQGLANSQAEVEALQAEHEGLTAQIDAATTSLTETQEQLTARENELAEIQQQIDSLCQQLGVTDSEEPAAAAADGETRLKSNPRRLKAKQRTRLQWQLRRATAWRSKLATRRSCWASARLAAGISALSEKEKTEEAQLAELTAQADSLTAEKTALEAQVAQQEQTIADLNGQIETLDATVADLQQQLDASQAELNDLKEQVDAATVALQGLAPEDEQAGEDEEGQPAAKAIGLAALAGGAATAVHRGKGKEEEYETKLAAYDEQVAALTGEKTELEATSQEQAAQIEALTGQVGDLEFTLQDKEKALADYNDSFLNLQGDVNRLAAEKSSLETALQLKDEELAQLQTQLADYEADVAQVQEEANRSLGTRAVGAVGLTAGAAAAAALQDKDEQLGEAAAQLAELQAQLESTLAEKAAIEEQLAAQGSELETTRTQLAATTPFEEATQMSDKLAQMPATKRGAATAAVLAGVQPYFVPGVQTINDVHGIGQTFQQRLYKAGIGTYWEVSCLSNEGLKESLQIPEIQIDRVDFNGIRASAYQWASESGTIGALWESHRIDDFEDLPGIGAAFEKRLYMAGIFTYDQLADAGRDRLAEIIDAPEFRQPDYGQIIEVARSRAEAMGAEAAPAAEAEADEAAEADVELDAPAEGEAEAVPEADAPAEEVGDEQ